MNKPVDPVKFIVEATGVAHWLPVIVSPGGQTKLLFCLVRQNNHKRMVRTII